MGVRWPNEEHEYGQNHYCEKTSTAINCDTLHPLTYVITSGFEYEPLVGKVRERYVEQI